MSSQASLTNQRLDVARRFLEMPMEHAWMGVAYENAAFFHIQSAFIGLLQEVKQEYGLTCEAVLIDLLEAASTNKLNPPVLVELKELRTKQESWLNGLQANYEAALFCDANLIINKSLINKNDNLISSAMDNTDVSLSYLDALTDLILRFREESIEY